MKLVYVCREVAPLTGGGIGTYIANVLRVMHSAGHEVTLVSDLMGAEPESFADAFPGIKWMCPVTFPPERFSDFMCEHQAYAARVYETLLSMENEQGMDVVEFPEFRAEGFMTIRAKRTLNQFRKTRLVVKCHTPYSLIREINDESFLQPRHEMDVFMEDYCMKHADLVTSPSASLRDYVAARIGRTDLSLCPYPLNLPEHHRIEEAVKHRIKRVRFFGSLQPRKGLEHLIDAALAVLAKDDSFTFEIFGGERNQSVLWTEYGTLLKRRVPQQWKGHILFRGSISPSEVPLRMQEAGIVLLPSRWENWANVCLEAMSLGCLVLASKSGGMSEMIREGESGFLLDPEQPEATGDSIRKISSMDESELAAISKAAQSRARELCDAELTRVAIEANYRRPIMRNEAVPQLDSHPLVSVVIPFFNQHETLPETLKSVHQSDYPSVEIVLVDDGSDHPVALELMESMDGCGFTVIRQKNQGLSAARNAGIASSKGEFVLPLDSDDTLAPDYIRKAVECLIRNPELAYVGSHVQNFGAFGGQYCPIGFVKPLMAIQNTDIKCSGVFRRSAMEHGYDRVLYSYEDWDFLIGIHERGGEGDVLPEALFNYRRSHRSMVFSTANHQRAHLLQYMMKKHEELWRSDSLDLSRLLLRLWKEEEFDREFQNHEVVQVYYGVDGVFSESHASILAIPRGQWRVVRFKLPLVGNITRLRIDPCASERTVRIRQIKLETLAATPRLILHCSDAQTFAGVAVSGTAEGGWRDGSLQIRSTGNDPQILLEGFETGHSSCDLMVELMIDPIDGL